MNTSASFTKKGPGRRPAVSRRIQILRRLYNQGVKHIKHARTDRKISRVQLDKMKWALRFLADQAQISKARQCRRPHAR